MILSELILSKISEKILSFRPALFSERAKNFHSLSPPFFARLLEIKGFSN